VGTTVWIPRVSLERTLEQLLGGEPHICIDGPTGTGKTSLAITALKRHRLPFVLVQITSSVDWRAFCRQIVGCEGNAERAFSAELTGGVDKGIPHLGFKLSAAFKGRPSDRVEYLKKLVEDWTEHDVCRTLASFDTAFVIDDLERAESPLLSRLADMAKLLMQSYIAPNCKLIFIGTGDVFSRLYSVNPSLDARLTEVSVGTLSDRRESWTYILKGLDRLGLTHPGNDQRIPAEMRRACIQSLYFAANGLLKSLSDIGRRIALAASAQGRVSPATVRQICDPVPMQNLTLFRREFHGIVELMRHNPAVCELVQILHFRGVGQIHHWHDLLAATKTVSSEQLDNAVAELIQVKFLVRTGQSGDVLFVQNPSFAHTLGVLLSEGDRFPEAAKILQHGSQLSLPLLGKMKHDSHSDSVTTGTQHGQVGEGAV
jgi:hypothetical protein